MHTVRLDLAVGDYVEAQLALRALGARVGRRARRPEQARHLCLQVAFWQVAYRLLHDAHALAHLGDAHHVAVVAIAVVTHRDLEVESVVDAVGVGSPHIVLDAAGTQDRARGAVGDGQLGRQDAHVARPRQEDLVVGEQSLVFVDLLGHDLDEAADLLHAFGRYVATDPAVADVAYRHARATAHLVDIKDALTLAERVEQRCEEGPNIGREGADGDAVRGDALQLAHDDANVLSAL